jgi:ribosome recycling factor
MTIEQIKTNTESRMKKPIEILQNELAKLRTGRAHPSLLDHIAVSYYGNDTPLSQVASVTVSDSRTLMVTPWEKTMTQPIEKAIMTSGLGLNPATSGNTIRVPLPPLTEERRKEMAKQVKNEAENARVAIRNVRRDANTQFKDLLKKKEISEDDERRAQDIIQKLTDKYIAEVDKISAGKEKELMEI